MKRQSLIGNTIRNINQLPDLKIKEVNDFTEFLLSKIEDRNFQKGLQQLTADSKAFDFLKDEEDLCSTHPINHFNLSSIPSISPQSPQSLLIHG